ncbi:transcriptional regulator YeiL [Helicovermis profundi]|uniref:Transcriptional regulator YeiL n=2 Tax=Helicovermis profundi TaxID=3065157 RepID=A0AAU9EHF4_9FIRM|nr:transcriptional regulator YeiL [Clostridia bacterium S502]
MSFYLKKYEIKSLFDTDISSFLEIHKFKKGESISVTDEPVEFFYFQVEGKSKVFKLLKNGKSLLMKFFNPLEIIGEIELIQNITANSNITATSECVMIGIEMKKLKELTENDITFLKFLNKHLVVKLKEFSLSSSINLLYPLENRLASYILATSSRDDSNKKFVDGINTNKLTEMADLLGTSYRHLNRTLKGLQDKGLVKKEKSSIIIINKDELENLAADLYE